MADGSIGRQLLLVVLGAFLGVVPVITNNRLEAAARARQALADQRLGALRDYARSCDRFVAALQQVAIIEKLGAEAVQGGLDEVDRELNAASLEQTSQIHIVTALFGDHAKLKAPDLMPGWVELESKSLDDAIKRLASSAPKAGEACEADVTTLAKLLHE